jgi:WD repeat-containing protein 35
VRWSEEDPEQFATLEKTRLLVFSGTTAEEPVACHGYLCQFRGLRVKTALMDSIMASPESLEPDWVADVETKGEPCHRVLSLQQHFC